MNMFTVCIIFATAFLCGCDRPDAPAYQLDLESLNRVDPSWVTFRQAGLIKLPIASALGIAVLHEPRRFAVAHPQGVFVVDMQGKVSSEQTLPVSISSICATPENQLFVVAGNQLFKGHAGALKTWLTLPEGAFVCALAFSDGYVWAADSNLGKVYVLDAEGVITATIGKQRNGSVATPLSGNGGLQGTRNGSVATPHFVLPSRHFDVYPAPDGTVWVTNPGRHRLENYRADGSLVGSWGEAGMQLERFAGCCNPSHIAVFPNARFATAEKGLIRIKEYDQQGRFSGLICGREMLKNDGSGLDLACLDNDSIAVLDPDAGVIRIVARKPQSETNPG